MRYTHRLDPAKVQVTYDVLVEVLIKMGVTRAEAITALLTVLGTQFYESAMEPELTAVYMQDAMEWYNTYFEHMTKESNERSTRETIRTKRDEEAR